MKILDMIMLAAVPTLCAGAVIHHQSLHQQVDEAIARASAAEAAHRRAERQANACEIGPRVNDLEYKLEICELGSTQLLVERQRFIDHWREARDSASECEGSL